MARGRGRAKATVVKKVAFPCSVCDKAAGVGTIQCSGCAMWTHRECVPLDQAEFDEYSSSSEYFLCSRCVSTGDVPFDYGKSLRR
jgi:hypothetical protein